MKENTNLQYRFATFFAIFALISYGLLRFIENRSHGALSDHGLISFYLSIFAAVLVFAEHLLLRKFSIIPFIIVSTMNVSMTAGAYLTTEWDYYYLASLGMIGIICLYGKIRSLILYQASDIAINICIFLFLLDDTQDGFKEHMFLSFLLYLFGAASLIILFYRANKKESAAQIGLQAFSSLLGSTPNLMVIIDDKRKVRYISTPLAKFAGMDEKAAIGRPLIDLFKAENLKLMFADILDTDEFYSATREIEMNNESRYFKIIADKLSNNDTGMFIEITDMTEIVLASMEADEARKEAEAANKSKSAFLTTMSHEIRTPMNAIIGVSEIQLARENLPDDIAQAYSQIHTSGHGLLGIINDILDLSKIETGKLELRPTDYDIASLINDTIQLNIVRIGSKPINFFLELDDDLPARMIGDELRLKQVLNNILSNAFKYTDQGTVKLSISHHTSERGIYLTLKISDTGQGMKQEDLARLFEAYTRFNTKENRYKEGTGLGMNITSKLVKMMDGNIEVDSEYGKGSTFTVTVLQKPSEDKAVVDPVLAEKLCNFTYEPDHRKRTIQIKREYMPYGSVLVVDDVETNLYVARGLLAPYGLAIDTAAGGLETIEKISRGAAYDIVFMDHMMPQMDGVETTRCLRDSGYSGIIVALTANAIAGNDKFFRENGFDDYISKPIDIRQMNAALNKYVRDRQRPEITNNPKVQTDTIPQTAPDPTDTDITLLKLFKHDAEKAIITLTESHRSGDYKSFATAAHGIKSASANLGETKISHLAESLETAGKENNKTFIDEHTPGLIDALQMIIARATPPTSEVLSENTTFLHEKINQLRTACENYDVDTALDLLKLLGKQAWKADTSAALDEISEMILCSDFDEAAEKAAALCIRS